MHGLYLHWLTGLHTCQPCCCVCAVEPQEFGACHTCLLSPSSQERQLGRTAHEDSHKATKGLLAPRKGMRTTSAGATEGQRAFHQNDTSIHLQVEHPALGVRTCSFLYQNLSNRLSTSLLVCNHALGPLGVTAIPPNDVNKWTERKNEWKNERIKEWKNEWMKKDTHTPSLGMLGRTQSDYGKRNNIIFGFRWHFLLMARISCKVEN